MLIGWASGDRAQTLDDGHTRRVPGREHRGDDADDERRAELYRDRLVADVEDRKERSQRFAEGIGQRESERNACDAADRRDEQRLAKDQQRDEPAAEAQRL